MIFPSLQEYLLVNYKIQQVEIYRRADRWERVYCYGPGQDAELASLDLTFSVDELYATRL